MNARHVKNSDFTTITISKETHQQLVNLPWFVNAKSSAVMNRNGTVTFPVGLDLHAKLLDVHEDVELAIQIFLGLKTN
jgi:hypothetical protein